MRDPKKQQEYQKIDTQQRGRWKIAKKWLRFEKYPQWEKLNNPSDEDIEEPEKHDFEWIWYSLKEQANPQPEWLDFEFAAEFRKDIVIPSVGPQLKSNVPYFLKIDLQFPERDLLLLNRGLIPNPGIIEPL